MSFRPYARTLSGCFTNSLALSCPSSPFIRLRRSLSLSLSLSLSISISLCPLLFHSRTCNVSCRSPIFTSDARLLHDAALQVENTDRLCINRSRDTEPSRGERRRKTRARVTRAERNQEGDEVSRKRERERERGGKNVIKKRKNKKSVFLVYFLSLFFSCFLASEKKRERKRKIHSRAASILCARAKRRTNKNSSVQSRSLNVSLGPRSRSLEGFSPRRSPTNSSNLSSLEG